MFLLTSFLLVIHMSTLLAAAIDAQAKILKYENVNDGSGNYKYSYKTSNGIVRDETGTLVNGGQRGAYIKVEGTISYTDANDHLIIVTYSADENGYHILSSADLAPLSAEIPVEEPPIAAFGSGSPGGCAIIASLCG